MPELKAAARSVIIAMVARRDARRMLDIGFEAATAEAQKALGVTPRSLAAAIELLVVHDAAFLVEWYDRHPEEHPAGRTADTALEEARARAAARYTDGKCGLCGGKALPCAKRHAKGRSCA